MGGKNWDMVFRYLIATPLIFTIIRLPADGLALGDIEGLALSLADGLILTDGLADGEADGLADGLADGEAD